VQLIVLRFLIINWKDVSERHDVLNDFSISKLSLLQ